MEPGVPCETCREDQIRAAFAAGVERGAWENAYDMARSTSRLSEPRNEPPDEDAYMDSLLTDQAR